MLTEEMIDREIKVAAKRVLSLSENELYDFWLKKVACDYWHGNYLRVAIELSKKRCFNRWKKSVVELAEEAS